MRIPLAAVGFTSIIAQVILMRELVATFYGNELLFGLVLMAWLAWVAAGSWGLARTRAARRRLGTKALAAGLALAGALLLAQILLVRDARTLLGVTPGAFVELGPMVAAVVLIPAPLCLLTGLSFTLGARLMIERGGTGGGAYAWESVGALAGGALFSFALVRWLDSLQTALLVSAANLTVAAHMLRESQRPALPTAEFNSSRNAPAGFGNSAGVFRELSKFFLLCAVLTAAALPVGRFLHQASLGWQWPDLVFAADSPYGRLTIQARDGQRVFFQNGLLAFETQGTFPEEVAHFPLLAHPDPRRVLLIGGGMAGDLREILKHPVTSLTYVELDPLLIEAARTHLPPQDAVVLDDPRLELALTDGRLYIKQQLNSKDAEGPDVVILDLPEPSTGALNRFYTREFFGEVRALLNPDGLFALGLPSAENYWSPELARRNGSVYHTLRAVFPEILVLPGEHNFFLASGAPLEADPDVWGRRLSERGVETRWVTPDYIQYLLTTDRFAGVRRQLEATAGVRLNTDLTPICYYYDLALWLSRFYPNLGGIFFRQGTLLNLGWVVVPLALGVILARWRRGFSPGAQSAGGTVPIAMATVGLAGMTLEVVALFAFQVLHGYVYAQLSLIMTAFMAGLALGTAGANRLLARWAGVSKERTKGALLGVQLAVVVYSALFPFILRLPIPAPTLIFPWLMLLAGALGGMAFPLALAFIQGEKRSGNAAGMLYGADLIGGCLGALLGAVFLIPLLGIPQTCLVVALVALAGLLVLI